MEIIKKEPIDCVVKRLSGYEKKYYLKYSEVIPRLYGGVKEKDRETVYKNALEQGKTWEEITGMDKMPKDTVI